MVSRFAGVTSKEISQIIKQAVSEISEEGDKIGFGSSGLPWSEKSQGKRKLFKVREKSGKIFDVVKVSERSGNSVFWFIVHKFSSRS